MRTGSLALAALCFFLSTGAGCALGAGPKAGFTGDADGSADPSEGGGGGRGGRGEDGGDGSSAMGSGGLDGGPSKCGSQVCLSGGTCVASACVYGCVGSKVPGDYATIQAAVNALTPAGGTICLAAQNYPESVSVNSMMPMSLIGISSDKSLLQGITVSGTTANVTLKGIGVATSVTVGASGTVNLGGMNIRGAGTNAMYVYAANSAGVTVNVTGSSLTSTSQTTIEVYHSTTVNFTMDECEVSGSTSYPGINITDSASSTINQLNVTVQNSYIHGTQKGVYYGGSGSSAETAVFKINNNTFMGNTSGIQVSTSTPNLTFSYFNNAFSENTTAIDLTLPGGSPTVKYGNNGLFGNVANYNGAAVDGPGYVKADLMLDKSTTPPSLKVGSPCLGAGDRANAPAYDYWGNVRGASVDIGAVQ